MSAETVIRDYYEALRRGEALVPYFTDAPSTVKFGISESLFGGERVERALREQTETTDDWTVESHRLTVDDRVNKGIAWFADECTLAWTDETGDRQQFETRWSGTLERRDDAWQFVSMHVSAPQEI